MAIVAKWRWLLLVFATGLWLVPAANLPAAVEDDDTDDLPVAGRPDNFSGAVGRFKDVTMTAAPTELKAETPLKLTIRITAEGPVRQPPRRLDLRTMPEFVERFAIEDLPDANDPKPGQRVWQFDYRLKPRSEKVTVIPAVAFSYFDPDLRQYQTAYADREIPLKVGPPDRTKAEDVVVRQPPPEGPESLYRLAEGAAVLRRQESSSGLVWTVIGLLLAPPVLGLGWYAVWRRRHPGVARLAQQRRSRAAQQALSALETVQESDGGEQARKVSALVTAYLHDRLDLSPADPTPAEAAAHLRRLGLSPALSGRTARFYRGCDAVRFAPEAATGPENLPAAARDLILALETASWEA